MELHDLLKQQKSLSEAMIDEKNKLINDFQMVRFINRIMKNSFLENLDKFHHFLFGIREQSNGPH